MTCLTFNCLATCLIFFLLTFHSGCLHIQLGEKSVSHRSIISEVFYHWDLNEEYKWKAVFLQTWCFLISLYFFFKGLTAFSSIAGKQPDQRDLTSTNTFCEIIIQLTLQSLKTLRLHGLWRLNSLCLKEDKILLQGFSVCLFFYIYSLPAWERGKEKRSALLSWYFWHFFFLLGKKKRKEKKKISCYSKHNLLLFM